MIQRVANAATVVWAYTAVQLGSGRSSRWEIATAAMTISGATIYFAGAASSGLATSLLGSSALSGLATSLLGVSALSGLAT